MEQLEKVCKGLECCILRDPDDEPICPACEAKIRKIMEVQHEDQT